MKSEPKTLILIGAVILVCYPRKNMRREKIFFERAYEKSLHCIVFFTILALDN